jgi:hypothetical protein
MATTTNTTNAIEFKVDRATLWDKITGYFSINDFLETMAKDKQQHDAQMLERRAKDTRYKRIYSKVVIE